MAQRGKRVWTDPAELEKLVEDYFQSRYETRKMRTKGNDGEWVEWEETFMRPPTMAGLALAIGVDRQTLINYQERDGFRIVLMRAKHRIAEWVEEALYTREGSNGARFALEVNHRYGKEDQRDGGGGFQMEVIAPAQSAPLAIPKWDDGDE